MKLKYTEDTVSRRKEADKDRDDDDDDDGGGEDRGVKAVKSEKDMVKW